MKRLVIVASITLLAALSSFASVSAQDPLDPVCSGSGSSSAVCQSRTSDNPLVGPSGILTRVLQILVIATAVASVIMIMVGGLKYIVSSGDPNNVNSAKNTILYAIVGLVVVVIAQSIVSLVLRRL